MPIDEVMGLMLGVPGAQGGGGATPIVYLLRDEFLTDEAAPLTSPRAAEPGPGTWSVTETDGASFSISEIGYLEGVGISDYRKAYILSDEIISRLPGVALFYKPENTQNAQCGLYPPGVAPIASTLWANSGLINVRREAGRFATDHFSLSGIPEAYEYCIVLHDLGSTLYGKYRGVWRRLFMEYQTNTPAYSVGFAHYSGTTCPVDRIHVRQLPPPFQAIDDLIHTDEAVAASDVAIAIPSNALVDLEITAPEPLDGESTTRCGFYYRADTDSAPAVHLYIDGTGACRLDSIDEAGTRTNRVNVASVITAGQTLTLRAVFYDTRHACYTLTGSLSTGTTWTRRGGVSTSLGTEAVERLIPSAPTGWTLGALKVYPVESSEAVELDRGMAITVATSGTIELPQNLTNTPAVLFTFDDGNECIWGEAFQYMRLKNVPGTAYIITDVVGNKNKLSVEKMAEMYHAGWDMGNHTAAHDDLSALSQEAQEITLEAAAVALEGWGFSRGARHVAYPYSLTNASTEAAMAATNMITGRTVDNADLTLPADNYYSVSCYGLNSATTLEAALGLIDTAVANNSIVILLVHYVGPEEWPAAYFRTLVNYALEQHVYPLTISQLWALTQGPLTLPALWAVP